MSVTLFKKLQIKNGNRFLMLNAPLDFEHTIKPIPPEIRVDVHPSGNYDAGLLFASVKADLDLQSSILMNHLKPGNILWVAFPKKNSGVLTDISMSQGWESLHARGLHGVSLVSVDDHWSAMRFKPLEDIAHSETSNRAIRQNSFSDFIKLDSREIILPADLDQAFAAYPEARERFGRLSFTNKKEYMVWILSAKSQDTRRDRIQKSLEKLRSGKKNPSEK